VEPVVTKTVSYFNISAVIVTLASGEVIKESFLQEKRSRNRDMVRIPGVFIGIKSKAKSSKEEMRKRDRSRVVNLAKSDYQGVKGNLQ
jgi:hypothetical protein